MQLSQRQESKSVKAALSAATAALLSFAPSAGAADDAERAVPPEAPKTDDGFVERAYQAVKGWAQYSGQLGYLYYSETGRVTAHEPSLELTAQFSGERRWTQKLTVDTLTGASHNGGIPSRTAQTFTGPSGQGTYRAGPGQLPLDSSFHDTRIAYATTWSQPLGERHEFSVGGGFSSEYDYRSVSLNSTISRYFNMKNTKLTLGASVELDESKPVGGAPAGFDTMAAKNASGGAQSKTVYDLLLGVTQVINRRWIVQANYSFGQSSGYMSDPYKIVTEVAPEGSGNAGDPTGTYYFEKRPESRSKNSVYLSSKYHLLSAGIVTGSYRYFWDDWGVKSHTFGAEYELPIGPTWHLGFDGRYYLQQKADFYRPFLVQGQSLPASASADYRLGDMDAYTVGVKVGKRINDKKQDVSVHLQYYQQMNDGHPAEAFGALRQYDLSPPVKAVIGKVVFTF